MNEVTKLYENAGVEKHYCSFESCDGNVYNWELNEDGEEKYNKCFLGKPKIKQRLFTAEKQIELIKFLCTKRYIDITFTPEKEYYIFAYFVGCGFDKNFDEALAMFVNQYWNELSEEERKQIKEILE